VMLKRSRTCLTHWLLSTTRRSDSRKRRRRASLRRLARHSWMQVKWQLIARSRWSVQ
jgi:hypothetical protein